MAQTDDCRCNELFDKDLKNQFTSFSSQNSKELLYKYFSSDQTTRQAMKNDASLEGSVGLVIKAIPINIGFGSSSSSSSDRFYSMYKQSIENKYISDEVLQSLYTTALPDKSFTAYEQCLIFCGANKNGIILRNISTQDDLIVLELKFKSIPSGGKISIKDAIYSNGTVIGGKKFETDAEILDGQVLYEHIKLRPEDNITVTIAFNEGVPPASFSLQSKNKVRKSSDAPLGTIVASLLNYNDFLKLNGLEYDSDINKVIWVPCDGRNIGTAEGTYGAYSGGKAPDLRGLFLRSVNDMGAYNATVPTPIQDNLNPEKKQAGQTQMDAFQGHKHIDSNKIAENYGKESPNTPKQRHNVTGAQLAETAGNIDAGYGNPRLSIETRPKNISVYYYIKIR
ncbi:hypothetical protein AS589_07900 [Empedobacter brevis]|nr:hypothetical protein AS589_07900 [Empedobacter brevis]